jgi:hypothetical protein
MTDMMRCSVGASLTRSLHLARGNGLVRKAKLAPASARALQRRVVVQRQLGERALVHAVLLRASGRRMAGAVDAADGHGDQLGGQAEVRGHGLHRRAHLFENRCKLALCLISKGTHTVNLSLDGFHLGVNFVDERFEVSQLRCGARGVRI